MKNSKIHILRLSRLALILVAWSTTFAQGNTHYGTDALESNTTGHENSAFGTQSLSSNTTGSYNSAFGNGVLYFNKTGNSNTALGWSALLNNTGSDNTAVGLNALQSNTTADYNTATGYWALPSSTSCCNTAAGNKALYYVSSGRANTGVGNNAGATVDSSSITGNNNTFLGTGTALATGSLTNATALGANAEVGASNALVLGSVAGFNNQTVTVHVGIGTTTPSNVFTIGEGAGPAIADGWDTYSSRRWKTNIQTLPDALSKVERMRGVSYDLKNSGRHEIGVIAEEVGAVVPEVVSYEENGKDARGVDYSRLTALLIEALKQQQREIAALRAQLGERMAKDARLESRISELEQERVQVTLASARRVP